MHHYPLHRNVEASCTCCRIKRDFTFKSPTDHVVCPGCARHQGNSPNQESLRNSDHADLFRSEFMLAQEERKSDAARHYRALEAAKAVTAERDEVIAEKNATIVDLRATIQTGDMNPMVETWLAEEAVKQAHEQRDSAYRSRSYAYESLWRLSRIHRDHDTELDHCACGRKSDKCKELLAIREALPAVKRWENAELGRLHENLNQGLPPDHPEVLRLSPHRRRWG